MSLGHGDRSPAYESCHFVASNILCVQSLLIFGFTAPATVSGGISLRSYVFCPSCTFIICPPLHSSSFFLLPIPFPFYPNFPFYLPLFPFITFGLVVSIGFCVLVCLLSLMSWCVISPSAFRSNYFMVLVSTSYSLQYFLQHVCSSTTFYYLPDLINCYLAMF